MTRPDDLRGSCGLLVLAVRRRQQGGVDGWPAAAEGESRQGLGFRVMPVFARAWGPLRGWIDLGMVGAIAGPDIRAHTLTAYTDVGIGCRALGTDRMGRVVPMLVAGGVVLWQDAGLADAGRIARLRAASGTGAAGPVRAVARRVDMTKIGVPATL